MKFVLFTIAMMAVESVPMLSASRAFSVIKATSTAEIKPAAKGLAICTRQSRDHPLRSCTFIPEYKTNIKVADQPKAKTFEEFLERKERTNKKEQAERLTDVLKQIPSDEEPVVWQSNLLEGMKNRLFEITDQSISEAKAHVKVADGTISEAEFIVNLAQAIQKKCDEEVWNDWYDRYFWQVFIGTDVFWKGWDARSIPVDLRGYYIRFKYKGLYIGIYSDGAPGMTGTVVG